MTNYYVSPTGNDINNGLSEAQAWKTIQYAANSVSAGDIVTVLPGTYTEKVTISRSGIISNPIIFQGSGMPTITWTGTGYTTGPVIISGSYITITGFNIIAHDTVYDIASGGFVVGIRVAYGSGAKNLNISNNYIWTQSGYGILLHENSSSNSVINNNEIHTGHQAGIALLSPYTIQENITITNNIIYVDENKMHRDSSDASGIWTYYGTSRNFNVLYNKIMHSGYTAIKVSGSGHKINYNEIGPDGYVHNGIELLFSETEMIGNYIYDTSLTWATQLNQIYSAGTSEKKEVIIKDNIVSNCRGRALTCGGHQHKFLIENLTVDNFKGTCVQVLGYDSQTYPSPVVTSNNLMFVNLNLSNVYGTSSPLEILSIGTKNIDGTYSWDYITFINVNIFGTCTNYTWRLANNFAESNNWHFDGTIFVINCNKDDTVFGIASGGTFLGEIIFYYYIDVKVVDINNNPINNAKVTFTCNDSLIKAKSADYKYIPFPGQTPDVDTIYTGVNGHTPLYPDLSTVAIAGNKKKTTGTTTYSWTITAEKYGTTATVSNITPNTTWYRAEPNIVGINDKLTIQLPIEITNGAVIGKVTDSSGIPIKDVNIDINGTIVLTDTNGDYGLGDLLPGTYNMTISKTGYISTTDNFTIITNEVITKNFILLLECPIPICEFTLTQL